MNKITAIIFSLFIISLTSCDAIQELIDNLNNNTNNTNNTNNNNPTTAKITNPQNGTVFNHDATINVAATAEDADGIKEVTLYTDNKSHSTDISKPYTFKVNLLASGNHTLFVRALDNKGNSQDSGRISITIKAPPPTSTVSNKFTVTSVNDDLNNSDGQDFINGFKQQNFSLDQWDKDVSTSELKSYLEKKQEFLYHTGHGIGGKIITSNGSLSSSGLIVNTKAFIIATCLTLKDTNWKKVFGSTSQIIMGYTKISYDSPTDNNLIKSFLSNVKGGDSYMKAWYKSNSAISLLKDRWLGYVKEGSQIVEYSARSNNIPKRLSNGIPIGIYDQVSVDSNLLDNSVRFERGFQGASLENTSLPLASRNEDINKSAWPSISTYITIDEAITIAENELANSGGKPENALLDEVIPIQKCNENNNCFTVAYQVNYIQKYNGHSISSNVGTDYIALLIDNRGVVSMDFSWSTVRSNNEIISTLGMLNVGDALNIAGPSISQFIRGNTVFIISYKTVHGVKTLEDGSKIIVPAYEFLSESGERFVVSAVDGKLVF